MLFLFKRTALFLRSTFVTSLSGPQKNNWDGCGVGIDDVLSNRIATYNGFSAQDILKYAWTGDVRGLDPQLRNDTFYLAYPGCLARCPERTIGYNTSSQGLNVVATWIFPLAILFSLPFEHKIFLSITNWLGSPQTALTASIWNFWQIRKCYHEARPDPPRKSTFRKVWRFLRGPTEQEINNMGNETADMVRNRIDAFYVLSCFNQFDLGFDKVHRNAGAREAQHLGLQHWLTTLNYGLFRPLAGWPPDEDEPHDIIRTKVALSVLAQELRRNRRKGVVQSLLTLVIFMMAFGFSIVLAFDDLSSSTSIFVLDIGIFYLWVPVVVVFFILDRNPADSGRSKRAMERWHYNAEVIRTAALGRGNLNLWTEGGVPEIGDFVGQGRILSYCGLSHAVMEATRRGGVLNWGPDMGNNTIPNDVINKLSSLRQRPWMWHIIGVLCLALVWIDVVWAAWADFITPTFGPGCWSLAFIFYGFFSAVTWVMQYRPLNPEQRISRVFRRISIWVSHFFNTLAVLYMMLMLLVFVSDFHDVISLYSQLTSR